MSERELRLRVETTADTKGIEKLDQEVDQVVQTAERLDRNLAEMGQSASKADAELAQLETTLQSGSFEAFERDLEGTSSELARTSAETAELRQELGKAANELAEVTEETKDLEQAEESLREQLVRTSKEWQEHNKQLIAMKSEAKSLIRQGMLPIEDEMVELSGRIQKAEQAEYELIQRTRQLMTEFRQSDEATAEFEQGLTTLNQKLNRAESFLTGVSAGAKLTAAELRKLGRGVTGVGDELTKANKKLGISNEELTKISLGMKAIVVDILFDLGRQIADFTKEALQDFYDFDTGLREVMTLVDRESGVTFKNMKQDVRNASLELARLPDEVVPAVYQGLSRGIPEDNILDAIELSSNAARAGVSSLEETLVAGQSVVKAYGDDVINLERVYDLFFTGIKEGAITMRDLAGGVSEVTSAAGEIGVPLEDVIAMLVVMTNQGDSFNEAISLSSLLIVQLGLAGTNASEAFQAAWGGTFREFIAQGGSMADALQILEEHAQETRQSMADLIAGDSPFYRDQQAARGALELTGVHMEEFIDMTRLMETEGAGALDRAMTEMSQISEMGSLRMQQAWAEAKIAFIEFLESLEYVAPSDLFGNAANLMNFFSGANARAMETMIAENAEAAESMEDLIALGQQLVSVRELLAEQSQIGLGSPLHGLIQNQSIQSMENLKPRIWEITRAIAVGTDNITDFRIAMQEAFGDSFVVTVDRANRRMVEFNGTSFELEAFFNGAELSAERFVRQLFELEEGVTTAELSERELAGTNYGLADSYEAITVATELSEETLALWEQRAERVSERTEFLNGVIQDSMGNQRDNIADVIEAMQALEEAENDLAESPQSEEAAERVEDMSTRMVEALAAVQSEYRALVLTILEEKLGEAMSNSMINALEAMGEITAAEAEMLRTSLATSEALKDVGAALTNAFLVDGQLTREEAELLAGAIEGVATGAFTADDALDAFSDGSLGKLIETAESGILKIGSLKEQMLALDGVTANTEVIVTTTYQGDPPPATGTYPGDDSDPVALSSGGVVTGGVPGQDSVDTRLAPGEVVISEPAAAAFPGGPYGLSSWLNEGGASPFGNVSNTPLPATSSQTNTTTSLANIFADKYFMPIYNVQAQLDPIELVNQMIRSRQRDRAASMRYQ